MIRTVLRRMTVGRWPAPRADEQLHCADVARLLQPYLDQEVPDAGVVTAIESHLEDCRRCGLEADTYESIRRALQARRPALDPDSLDRLRAFGAQLADGTN